MRDFLKKIADLLFSRTVLGIMALIGFVAIFRPNWFHEERPDLVIETVSNAEILGVREPLAKLKIYYGERELSGSSETIRLIAFRVINTGSAAVRLGDFDPKFPLGILIHDGKIIESPTIISTNEYQKSIEVVPNQAFNGLSFNPMILDAGEYFTVNLLVLAKSGQMVTIEPIGKIAGVPRLRQIDATVVTKESTFQQAVYGGGNIQLVRMFTYFFGTILSFIGVLAVVSIPFDLLDSVRAKRYRRERKGHIENFINLENLSREPIYDIIFQMYLNQPLRIRNPYEGLVYAVNNNIDLMGLITPINQRKLHPAFDEPIDWVSHSLSPLEISVGERLKKLAEIDGDQTQKIELLKQRVTTFNSYLNSKGIPLVGRIQRAVEGFWYNEDKFREEDFHWK
ncbi:MAG: hypothetical protein EPO06_04320 [Burkholderiaceae bacterium]|nr:MAG: hypothetical protein EPO06_04320 [Burkholderiaceae bacterium]